MPFLPMGSGSPKGLVAVSWNLENAVGIRVSQHVSAAVLQFVDEVCCSFVDDVATRIVGTGFSLVHLLLVFVVRSIPAYCGHFFITNYNVYCSTSPFSSGTEEGVSGCVMRAPRCHRMVCSHTIG